MVRTLDSYKNFLKQFSIDCSTYHILLRYEGKLELVSHTLPVSLESIGDITIQNPHKYFSEETSQHLLRLAEKGSGLYFLQSDTLTSIEYPGISAHVLLFSQLENYVSAIILPSTHVEEIHKATILLSDDSSDSIGSGTNLIDKEQDSSSEKVVDSNEIFRQLAENTNEIFWLRDNNNVLYVNNQFEKIWGRSKQEFLDNPGIIAQWIHPDDIDEVEAWIDLDKVPISSPIVEHYRIIRPDGEVRWLGSRISAVIGSDGKPYRLVGIASDITEQKEFEDALMIAKEQAQESDMLKSTFLANISHEIRTPMNGIVGFSELIAREDIEPSTRQNYVSIMKKSSEQLVRIIDDIIDFAKLEANQIRVSSEAMNLNKLLDELFVFFENQLKQQGLNSVTILIKKGLDDADSEVLSDEHRIRQILSYLIDNSIKYTSEGFIELGYEIKSAKVEFYVKDSGIGIAPEKHDMIFERFRQVDEGHTRKYGGTGLGLPISKGLANLLGGDIWFESEEDQGSIFSFTVPYNIDSSKEEKEDGEITADEKYNWKDKLILVAEDDELNFEFMRIILEPSLAKVIRAKDGSQAVKICANMNFDIILMDIRLPVLNGIQATQQIREMGITTPIIAQTAFAMDDDENKCLSAGCNRYITKPISKDKLYSTIDELIKI